MIRVSSETRLGDRLAPHFARARYPFSQFFAWASTALGLAVGLKEIAEMVTTSSSIKEAISSGALAFLAVTSLGVLGYREFKLSRESKFAHILTHQEQASDILRDLRVFLRKFDTADPADIPQDLLARARTMIGEVLTIYADIYSILTSARCRTCVKLIDFGSADDPSPHEPFIFTLARDRVSTRENKFHDKRRADERADRLIDNSDFLQLWDSSVDDNGFYISNNLLAEKDYSTSSINYWRNIAGNPNKSTAAWPLWYRSTIVWPIRREAREDLGIEDTECLGFLTVDCHLPNVFRVGEHSQLGRMLANSLFPILDLYTKYSRAPHCSQQEREE